MKPNLKKATVQRLLPCIIDGAGVPVDLMQNAARRASNRQSFEDERSYERTLGVACALVRKYYNDSNNTPDKEEWTMSLEKGNTDRSYVYGRMLAYAKQLEIESMRISGKEPRETNAERLQNTFARHPQRTWKLLESRLSPYLKQFHGGNPKGAIGARMETELREVISLFTLDSFNNQPLSPVYLLGYSCQLAAFEQEKQLRLEEYEKRKVRKNEYIQS